jgi:hypothetical protein
MRSLTYVALATVFTLLSAAVAGATDSEKPEPTAAKARWGEQLEIIELDGQGRQATRKFELQKGLAILRVEHEGSSNFVVRLLDSTGRKGQTLFNQIGEFTGTRGFEIREPGQYLLDVQADGPWQVEIVQPRPETAERGPQQYPGKGYDITPFVLLDEGLTVFKLKHGGQSRFSAYLVDANGRELEQLTSVVGEFDGSKPVRIEKPGVYFLNIGGDGEWTVEIE